MSVNQDETTIRELETDDEMRICEDLQEQVWLETTAAYHHRCERQGVVH